MEKHTENIEVIGNAIMKQLNKSADSKQGEQVGGQILKVNKEFSKGSTQCRVTLEIELHVFATEGEYIQTNTGEEAIKEIDDLLV